RAGRGRDERGGAHGVRAHAAIAGVGGDGGEGGAGRERALRRAARTAPLTLQRAEPAGGPGGPGTADDEPRLRIPLPRLLVAAQVARTRGLWHIGALACMRRTTACPQDHPSPMSPSTLALLARAAAATSRLLAPVLLSLVAAGAPAVTAPDDAARPPT